MRKPGWFLTFLLLFASAVYAQVEVRLLRQSASGQTLIFNIGHLEGIKTGEFAAILKPIRDPQAADLKMVPVGKARSIKVNYESSIWIVYKVFDGELLVPGDKFELLTESKVLSGRRDYSVSRTEVVGDKRNINKDVYEALEGDRERLTKLGNKYQDDRKIHGPEDRFETDFNMVDVSVWEKERGMAFKSHLYRGPHREQFRRMMRIETFEKLIAQYLRKVNDPKFSYNAFYEEQKKDSHTGFSREKGNFMTEYDKFLLAQSKEKHKEAEVYRAMLARGEAWSDDFSDEELQTMLGRVAKIEENIRREKLLERAFRHQLSLSSGLGLYNNETENDSNHSRGQAREFELGYEFFPFAKVDKWQNWTFAASARTNATSLSHDDYNIESDEYSASLGVNFYPWSPPQVVNSILPFIGTYARIGRTNLTLPATGDEGKYSLNALPGILVGVKFQFSSGLYFRLKSHIEKQTVEVIKTDYLGSSLPDRADLVDAKLGLGIGYAF